MNRQTYQELGRRAAAEEPVVVDATFRYAVDRRRSPPQRALPPSAPSGSSAGPR